MLPITHTRLRYAVALYCANSAWFGSPIMALAAEPRNHDSARARSSEVVFANLEVGAEYLGLQTSKAEYLVDPARANSTDLGMTYSVVAGVRLSPFTVGARLRYGSFSDWQLRTIGVEAGLRFPFRGIESYVAFGAGYASVAGMHADVSTVYGGYLPIDDRVDIKGLNLRCSAGVDVYLSSRFSLGANLSADALFLRRRGDGFHRLRRTDPNESPTFPYAINGSGNALGGTFSAVFGLHL